MVFDQLRNLNKYISCEQYEKIEAFLEKVSLNMEEKYYEIDGKLIYARVMSYPTLMQHDCRIEAHDQYIDIQSSISGAERIDIFDRTRLDIEEGYNEDNDIVFYKEKGRPNVSINNIVGYFSMIFPDEAHRPKMSVGQQCEKVKKFVIKIHI